MKKKWKTEHARGMDAGPFRDEQPHLLINIIYTRICNMYTCTYIIYYEVGESRTGIYTVETGCWKLCQREISQRGRVESEGKGKEQRICTIYTVIYLWEHCRFEQNRTRAAETLVSHKIYETNWFLSLFPLPKLLLGTWFRRNTLQRKLCAQDPAELTLGARTRGSVIWQNFMLTKIMIYGKRMITISMHIINRN